MYAAADAALVTRHPGVNLLRGDPRKIVLARSTVAVASGNHRAPGYQPDQDTLAVVHHFKWRAGVLDDLRRRVEKFSRGTWAEHTPAVRDEAGRLLEHVARPPLAARSAGSRSTSARMLRHPH